jgi:hypothetical protein
MELHYVRSSQQPWLTVSPDTVPEESARIMEVNDIRLHIPETDNALVIPPESRIRKGTVLDRLYSSSVNRRQIERARNGQARQVAFRQVATIFRCSPGEVESAWDEILSGRYPLKDMTITVGQLMEDEYRALTEEIDGLNDDEDFVPRHKSTHWRSLAANFPVGSDPRQIVRCVDRLIAVTRLKEIQVLKGFRRVDVDGDLVPPDIDGSSGWLPALELYGEGIFLTLDEAVLASWEKLPAVRNRAETVGARFDRTGMKFGHEFAVTPRFLLLHTISHLLIRQLETGAGYAASSLKERIYCKPGKDPMSGILVYVATPDIIGSLGGLAELAEPERLITLLASLFDHARWCSLDPVCAEHEGQGPQLLNRAACHACALVPEPSCAYGNILLDRTFIAGNIGAKIPSLLHHVEALRTSVS